LHTVEVIIIIIIIYDCKVDDVDNFDVLLLVLLVDDDDDGNGGRLTTSMKTRGGCVHPMIPLNANSSDPMNEIIIVAVLVVGDVEFFDDDDVVLVVVVVVVFVDVFMIILRIVDDCKGEALRSTFCGQFLGRTRRTLAWRSTSVGRWTRKPRWILRSRRSIYALGER